MLKDGGNDNGTINLVLMPQTIEEEEDIWSIFVLLIDLSQNERKLTSPNSLYTIELNMTRL
jgi:hypothetical protein